MALALIVARLIDPESKLATARALVGALLGLSRVSANDVSDALDWLGEQQARIEKALARRHLSEGTLVFPRLDLHLPRRPLLRPGPARL